MPILHASIKDLRKSKNRAKHNQRIKNNLRILTKKLQTLVAQEGKRAEALEIAKKLQQALAKAAKVDVIKPNKASRRISTVYKQINKAK